MANEVEIPDLLPVNITPEVVLTPEMILDHQATLLRSRTAGKVQGSLERTEISRGGETEVNVAFVVTAPLLGYSHRLFRCVYGERFPYPTSIITPDNHQVWAADQDSLIGTLKAVFQSEYIRSVMQSLLARTNEGVRNRIVVRRC